MVARKKPRHWTRISTTPICYCVAIFCWTKINPIIPELPITTHADPRPFYQLVTLSVLMVKDNFVQGDALSPNPKILGAFPRAFPPNWSLLNAQQKKKKISKKREWRGEEKEWKEKVTNVVLITFKPKNSKFCFILHMPVHLYLAS